MTVTLHKVIPMGDMHSLVNWTFPASSNRRALSGLTSADIGKVAIQTDTTPATFWMVLNVSGGTATWGRLDQGAEAIGAPAFSTIFTSAIRIMQSDIGVTSSGGVISSIADQAGSGNPFTASGTQQPAVSTGINSVPGVLFDGVNDVLTTTVTLSLATPRSIYVVFKQLATASQANLFGAQSGTNTVYTDSANNAKQYNGSAANTNATIVNGTWYRAILSYTNTTADYFKLGSRTAVTGGNSGDTAGTNWLIGAATTAGVLPANAEFMLAVLYPGVISGSMITAADALVSSKYGSGVQI